MISIFIKKNLQDIMLLDWLKICIGNKNYLNLFKYIIYISVYIFRI